MYGGMNQTVATNAQDDNGTCDMHDIIKDCTDTIDPPIPKNPGCIDG